MTGVLLAATLVVAPATGAPAFLADDAGLLLPTPEDAPFWQSPTFGPFATMGAGAALLLTGGILWLGASGDASDLRGKYDDKSVVMRTEDAELAASAALRGRIGSTMLAVGLLSGAAGGLWFYVAKTSSGQVLALRVRF